MNILRSRERQPKALSFYEGKGGGETGDRNTRNFVHVADIHNIKETNYDTERQVKCLKAKYTFKCFIDKHSKAFGILLNVMIFEENDSIAKIAKIAKK